MLQQVLWIREGKNKRPYFLHKISTNKSALIAEREAYPKTKYWYAKTYNTKKNQHEHALYLNRIVHHEK